MVFVSEIPRYRGYTFPEIELRLEVTFVRGVGHSMVVILVPKYDYFYHFYDYSGQF